MAHQTVMSDREKIKGGCKERRYSFIQDVSLHFEWDPKRSEGRGHADIWGRAAWLKRTKVQRP